MGVPVEVTVKLLLACSAKPALSEEVIVGGASTVRVKDCEAAGFTPLEAVMVIG